MHLPQNLTQRLCAYFVSLLLFWPSLSSAFSAYSNDELDQLEKQFIQQINLAPNVIRDPLASEYINHLAKTLAQHGDLTAPYFFIVKSNEINAFAGPGGYIGINTALILASENESELAAVMAHEMAHVRQHHLYRMIEHQKQMRVPMLASLLASIALGVINPTLGSGALMGSMTGFAQDNINFVRSNEKEADRIGIDMLIKSGLDPKGMANFFKKMQQNSRYYYTDNVPAILRTHPLDDDRIAEAENRSLGLKQTNYPDHLEYHLFKELIRTRVAGDDQQLPLLEYYQKQCPQHKNHTACEYGVALALMGTNQYAKALTHLIPLLQQDPNNLYFIIATTHAELNHQQTTTALTRLHDLYTNMPDNYAVIIEYAQSLMTVNQADRAVSILLKGSRQFKQDLVICQRLARAQAANHQQGYAYFTLAQCHLLQGERREAVRKLKFAKTIAGKDMMLRERIDAKIDEIKMSPE